MRLLRLPIRLRPSAEGLVLSGWSRKDNFITWDSTLWKREICSQVLRLTDAARCIGLVVIDYTTTPQILRRPEYLGERRDSSRMTRGGMYHTMMVRQAHYERIIIEFITSEILMEVCFKEIHEVSDNLFYASQAAR